MYTHASFYTRQRMFLLGAVIFAFGLFYSITHVVLGENKKQEGEETVTTETVSTYVLATSTVPVVVRGVVETTEHVVVRAQASGVVTQIYAREGARVGMGELLLSQALPVTDAKLRLSDAVSLRTETQENASLVTKETAVSIAERDLETARAQAILGVAHDIGNTQDAGVALIATLESAIETVSVTADFVSAHKHLFTKEGYDLYESVLYDTYGGLPTAFYGNVLQARRADVADIAEHLARITATETPEELETVTDKTLQTLRALRAVLQSAEDSVLGVSAQATETHKTAYLTVRSRVYEARTNLAVAHAEFTRAKQRVATGDVAREGDVFTNEALLERATQEHALAQTHAMQTADVSLREKGVLYAEQSLGIARAPFSASVARVFVKEGSYVTAGEAMLSLVGVGGREITHTRPVDVLMSVRVGDLFFVGDEAVGVVDRVSRYADGGAGVVIVALYDEHFAVGDVVAGVVHASGAGDVYAVPRTYTHFDDVGMYVKKKDGEMVRPIHVHDVGSVLYVRLQNMHGAELVPAFSVRL